MNALTTGQLARQAGVNVETLRYYERRELLPEPKRTPSGYRNYSHEAVRRIRFIKRAQLLGFSLDEVRELLELRVDPDISCAAIKQRADVKAAEIEHKIEDLRRMRRALVSLSEACDGTGSADACPILDALDPDSSDKLVI